MSKKGDYPILYRASYANYPDRLVESTVPFKISVEDPCDAPVGVTGSVLTDQEYTITETALVYAVPVYTSDPVWCDITYSYTITDTSGDAVLTFDPLTQTFTFEEPTDVSLSGIDFIDYTITVTGEAGNITPTADS